jgi:hypothetical protein
MPLTNVAGRLTRDERMKIYELSGEGYSITEICGIFNRDRIPGTRVRIPGVDKILRTPEAEKFVAQFRIKFLKSLEKIPITTKAVRMDNLDRLSSRLMTMALGCRPQRSEKEVTKFLTITRRVIEITDLARNEMEQRPGVSIGIGLGQGDLNDLSDEQLKARRDEIIRRAAKSLNAGSVGADEITEGDEGSDSGGSSEILLAPSEELRREELQERVPEIPDLRQQSRSDKGMPAV